MWQACGGSRNAAFRPSGRQGPAGTWFHRLQQAQGMTSVWARQQHEQLKLRRSRSHLAPHIRQQAAQASVVVVARGGGAEGKVSSSEAGAAQPSDRAQDHVNPVAWGVGEAPVPVEAVRM